MAIIERHSVGKNKPHGLELFGLTYTGATAVEWGRNHHLPSVITAEYLLATGAPNEAIAVIRTAAHNILVEGLAIDNPDHYTSLLAEIGVGPLNSEGVKKIETDAGRTTDNVISIYSGDPRDNNLIEVVVNPAWGVQWKLKDHPFFLNYESKLGECQKPDLSEDPLNSKGKHNLKYIDPQELAYFAELRGRESRLMADEIHSLLEDIFAYPDKRVTSTIWNLPFLGIHKKSHSLDIILDAGLTFSFHIGEDGSKFIGITNTELHENEGSEGYKEIVAKAKEVKSYIDSFYKIS